MISYPSRHCTVELQALPSRIGQVRRIVSAQLRYWHLDPLIDRATLGVTELLTNVHQHAEPDKTCTVEMELLLDRLVVSVRDRDPRLPVLDTCCPPDADATCGRGLAMVAAVSDSWGARPEGEDGKVVWFTLPTPAADRTRPARAPHRTTADRRRFVEVAVEPMSPVSPAPVSEPVGPLAEPVGPVPEPVGPLAEPVGPVAEPVGRVTEPADRVGEPVTALAEPGSPVADPLVPVADPVAPVAEEPAPAHAHAPARSAVVG